MWNTTKPSSMMPVTAITHFLPTAVWYRLSGNGSSFCLSRRGRSALSTLALVGAAIGYLHASLCLSGGAPVGGSGLRRGFGNFPTGP